MDVEPSNGTLRRALERLIEDGYLERGEDKRYRPTSALFDNEEQE
jgi:DNA-binding IclR family transcriptional regulator